MFPAERVLSIVDLLPDAVVKGGWGIDALLGEQTREHRDLDVAVNIDALDATSKVLAAYGWVDQHADVPGAVFRSANGEVLDVHVVSSTPQGETQTLPDGTRFTFVFDRDVGHIGGSPITCLSPPMQVLTHCVHEPDDNDHADLRLLRDATGVALPPPFVSVRGDEPVRVATGADAAAFVAVRHRSWKVAYRGLLPGAVLDDLDVGAGFGMWWPFLRMPPSSRHGALVAGAVGSVVAIAVMRPCPDEDDTGEITVLYTDPTGYGKGIGARLLAAAVEWLRARDFRQFVLWTLRDNSGARRFYEREGWRWDGATRIEVGESVRYRLVS